MWIAIARTPCHIVTSMVVHSKADSMTANARAVIHPRMARNTVGTRPMLNSGVRNVIWPIISRLMSAHTSVIVALTIESVSPAHPANMRVVFAQPVKRVIPTRQPNGWIQP